MCQILTPKSGGLNLWTIRDLSRHMKKAPKKVRKAFKKFRKSKQKTAVRYMKFLKEQNTMGRFKDYIELSGMQTESSLLIEIEETFVTYPYEVELEKKIRESHNTGGKK